MKVTFRVEGFERVMIKSFIPEGSSNPISLDIPDFIHPEKDEELWDKRLCCSVVLNQGEMDDDPDPS